MFQCLLRLSNFCFKSFLQTFNNFWKFDLQKWNWKVIQRVIASDQSREAVWGPSPL